MKIKGLVVSAIATTLLATAAVAQGGPVASSCGNDIAKLCAGKPHDGGVRICLEQNYARVSADCKTALDTTGGGRGKGLGRGRGNPQ